jgi:hypothetical protein
MSDLRTAAQQALDAWDTCENGTMDHPLSGVMEVLRAALEQPNECQWQQDGDRDSGMYMASCNRRYFVFEDGTPSDNRMKHCCYCGKVLVEVLIEQEDDDE